MKVQNPETSSILDETIKLAKCAKNDLVRSKYKIRNFQRQHAPKPFLKQGLNIVWGAEAILIDVYSTY